MGTLWQDIRYGIRMLRKYPGFTAVAVLTLALGIGANTAVFTLVDALLLKSLPGVQDPQRLVLVTDNGWPALAYPLYERLRDDSRSLSGLFTATGIDRRKMTIAGSGTGEEEPVWAQAVSGDFFGVLGVSAVLGRVLTPSDDRPGDPRAVAVISHGLWQRRFRLDPAVVGSTITLDDVPFTIVGVAPRGFFGFVVGRRPDVWWPIQMIPQVYGPDWAMNLTSEDWGSQWLQIVGRPKPGVSNEQARAELDVIFQQMRRAQAEELGLSGSKKQDYLSHRIELRSAATGFTSLRGELRQLLYILMVIVGLVLLVACTNLGGLLLARGAARGREFSVRAALGAGRLALMRQLMTESLLLAGFGGALGLFLAQWGVHLLVRYIPGYGETVLLQLTPDLKVLAFTFLVSVGAALLFGLLPAWRGTRYGVVTALKDQAGNVMGRQSSQLWNKALMVVQIALSCCLLIGAGLFVRTLQKLATLDVGFDRENLLVFELNPGRGYDNNARRADLYEEVRQRVQNLPSVRSVSLSSIRSLGGSQLGWAPRKVMVEGRDPTTSEGLDMRGIAVARGYFRTMGIPLLLGRDFQPQDEPPAQAGQGIQSPRPVVIDQTGARKLFGNENPVGKLLQGSGRRSSWPPMEVIGVIGDVIHKDLREGASLVSIYFLETCRSGFMEFFHVRTQGSPLAVADGIRQAVRELDPHVEVTRLRTVDELVNDQLRRERMLSQLAGFFSLSALALACLGLYGILSYAVARRTPEIGLRIALGAQKHNVLAAVIRDGMTLTLIGCGLGVLLAAGMTRVVSGLLYGVTPTDPLTFILTVLLLGAVAFVACWLPARRAARIDPMTALRYE
jgi:predicted permease